MGIWLVRHGETEWSRSSRHTGSTDVELTEKGEREAQAVGGLLAGRRFDHVLSSPMKRARRTAELAGFQNPEIDPDLKEVDYGEYEGLTTPEIRATRPVWELFADGCPNGESPEQVQRRVDRLLVKLTGLGGQILLFGHGHCLRALTVRYLGLQVGTATRFALEAGSISVLDEGRDGPWLVLWDRRAAVPLG
jgi:broad specificity phosphatase PhoE